MTETGHGSDVAAIGTTATYDPATQEFVIHTPFRAAWKDYLGNAGLHGTAATVFARLITSPPGGARSTTACTRSTSRSATPPRWSSCRASAARTTGSRAA